MRYLTWLLAVVLLAGCSVGSKPKPTPAEPPPKTPAEVEKVLGARAREVVGLLKARNIEKLPAVVHPDKGLRFSPYPNVRTDKDLVFPAKDLKDGWVNKRAYEWGVHAGSGEPIVLGLPEYFDRWVYDVDFATAPKIGWGESIGKGTATDNWKDAYPNGVMVEFHFPGFDPKFQGMDWRSLRLVFAEKGGQWYLVGLIHGQWTP